MIDDEWMDGCMEGRMNGWMDGSMDGWTDERRYEQTDR